MLLGCFEECSQSCGFDSCCRKDELRQKSSTKGGLRELCLAGRYAALWKVPDVYPGCCLYMQTCMLKGQEQLIRLPCVVQEPHTLFDPPVKGDPTPSNFQNTTSG